MTLRHTQRAAVHGQRFTLVELLTVMVIMAILLAVTVPVIIKVTSGSSVEAASRMVGAQLRLARQEAIVRRKSVAVLFPTVDLSSTEKTGYAAFRSCVLKAGSYEFDSWVPNTVWSYAPVGAVIAEADMDGGTGASAPPDLVDDDGASKVWVSTVPGFASDVRAVVFRPSGKLATPQRTVTVVEGAAAGSTWTHKNDANWVNVDLNQYTGRVTFVRP